MNLRPLGSRVVVRRLVGDDLAEHCAALGLGALTMLVEARGDAYWARLTAVSPARAHHPFCSREHLEGRLRPGTAVLMRPGSDVMSVAGSILTDSCTIAAFVDDSGALVANGDHIIGEPDERAVQALLETELAIPDWVKSRGLCLTDTEGDEIVASFFSAIPLRCVSAGGGQAQEYKRDRTAPYTPDWREEIPAGSFYLARAPGSFRVFRADGHPLIVSHGRCVEGAI